MSGGRDLTPFNPSNFSHALASVVKDLGLEATMREEYRPDGRTLQSRTLTVGHPQKAQKLYVRNTTCKVITFRAGNDLGIFTPGDSTPFSSATANNTSTWGSCTYVEPRASGICYVHIKNVTDGTEWKLTMNLEEENALLIKYDESRARYMASRHKI